MESRCRYDITRPAEQGRPLWVARGNDALTATVKAAAAEGTLSAIGVGDDSSLVVEAGGDGRPVGVLVQVGDKAAMVTFGDLPAASTTSVAQSRARAIALAGSIAGALSTS